MIVCPSTAASSSSLVISRHGNPLYAGVSWGTIQAEPAGCDPVRAPGHT